MALILVTGSADGLGRMTAALLAEQGHDVVLHARSRTRTDEAMAAVPGARTALSGDLSSLAQVRSLAARADALGRFDAVVHNAAIGFREKTRVLTPDGLPTVFAVNTLAPYVLCALMRRPGRLVFVSSELHRRRGDPGLDDLLWERRPWQGNQAYSDTKLHLVLLAFALARRWPGVLSNALEPGWVATRMGGPRATGDLDQAHRTQAWLAASDEPAALVSGDYFFHKQPRPPKPVTRDEARQDALLAECARLSGVAMPRE